MEERQEKADFSAITIGPGASVPDHTRDHIWIDPPEHNPFVQKRKSHDCAIAAHSTLLFLAGMDDLAEAVTVEAANWKRDSHLNGKINAFVMKQSPVLYGKRCYFTKNLKGRPYRALNNDKQRFIVAAMVGDIYNHVYAFHNGRIYDPAYYNVMAQCKHNLDILANGNFTKLDSLFELRVGD